MNRKILFAPAWFWAVGLGLFALSAFMVFCDYQTTLHRRDECRASGRSWHETSATRGECWDR